jgi:hypothetical protein
MKKFILNRQSIDINNAKTLVILLVNKYILTL